MDKMFKKAKIFLVKINNSLPETEHMYLQMIRGNDTIRDISKTR